jgi:hypothetical protein
MQEAPSLLMLEFLTWVSSRRRTYDEAMDAWRSTCPRHTTWEDALIDGLIRVERGDAGQPSRVTLTAQGSALLEGDLRHRPPSKGAVIDDGQVIED